MIITNTVSHLKQLTDIIRKDKTIGFVPTMGSLHEGHLSLVKASKALCDFTIVSIFVNPTQFDNPDDFNNYPRTRESDTILLSDTGVDLIFIPSTEEIYPESDTRTFNFGYIDNIMEGRYRPGHFNGVAQIVSRLFDIIMPKFAFFGEKDFQQLAVVRRLVKQLNIPVQIVSCPVVREYDGLAMSSRNLLLTKKQREHVPLIAQTLFQAKHKVGSTTVSKLKKWIKNTLDADPELETEYVEIIDARTLQTIEEWDDSENIQLCVAVYARPVRLIDNIKLK